MHLVCGLDESPEALAAACMGAAIARRLDVELTLVHAVAPARGARASVAAATEQARAGEPPADRAAAAIDAHTRTAESLASLTGADVSLRVDVGDPLTVLREAATADGCGLLLIGHRPRDPWRELVAPSLERRLAAAPPCPLALVPEDASAELPRQVVVGCHGSTASQAATAAAGRLAARLGVQLSLVHAAVSDGPLEPAPTGWERYDAPRRHRRVARSAAADRPLSVEIVERSERSVATLDRISEDDRSAWVVIGQPAHGRLRSRLQQPPACRVADETGLPVIAVPDGAAVDEPAAG